MTGIEDVAFYFRRKGIQWTGTGFTLEQYIRSKGPEGLASEFRTDPDFYVVCEFAKRAGTLQIRSGIGKGLEEAAGLLFGIPLVGVADIVVGGIEIACNQKIVGETLLKVGTGLVGVFILGALLSSFK